MTHDDPRSRDPAEAPTVVLHDAYDRAAFDRAVANNPGLAERIEAGRRLYAGFWSLAFDVFCVLFKYAVALEPERDATRGRTAIARRVIGWVLSAPDLERLRAETTLDEPRATFGTTRILDLVRGMLTRHGEASSASLGEELELADGHALFVVEGNTARQRRVTIRDNADEMALIASGAAPGDRVIVVGHRDLIDGDRIELVE